MLIKRLLNTIKMPQKTIPDRWEQYTSLGNPIPGTRFLAFKVPLKKGIFLHADHKDLEAFTPELLISSCEKKNWKLGLVIDLTNTARYYFPRDFMDCGVEYQKIFTEGHVVPSADIIKRFAAIVDDYASRNKDNENLIGVHCTHGVNRTGYIVCRYMVDKLAFAADEAIKAYNEARGYAIERENYLKDLRLGPKLKAEEYAQYAEENSVKAWTPDDSKKKRDLDRNVPLGDQYRGGEHFRGRERNGRGFHRGHYRYEPYHRDGRNGPRYHEERDLMMGMNSPWDAGYGYNSYQDDF